jgi:hydrogenase expression/formation protein HypC
MKIEHVAGSVADVSAGEIRARVNIDLISRPKKGDYVLVHAGMAIEKIDQRRAHEITSLIAELTEKMDRQDSSGAKAHPQGFRR